MSAVRWLSSSLKISMSVTVMRVCSAIMGMASAVSASSWHRQPLAGETVVVELLEAAGDQQLLQLPGHGLEQVALLAVENIEIGRYARLDGGAQRLVAAAAAAAVVFRHVSFLRSR